MHPRTLRRLIRLNDTLAPVTDLVFAAAAVAGAYLVVVLTYDVILPLITG